MSQHPHLWGPLQDPCLRIPSKIRVSEILVRFMTPNPLYKTNVSRSMSQHPCLWVSGSMSQQPEPWTFYKIHVSGSSTRSMPPDPTRLISPDPCLSIYASASLFVNLLQDPFLRSSARSMSPDPLQDSCFRTHVFASMSRDLCLSIHLCGPYARSMSQDPLKVHRFSTTYLRNFFDPCPHGFKQGC